MQMYVGVTGHLSCASRACPCTTSAGRKVFRYSLLRRVLDHPTLVLNTLVQSKTALSPQPMGCICIELGLVARHGWLRHRSILRLLCCTNALNQQGLPLFYRMFFQQSQQLAAMPAPAAVFVRCKQVHLMRSQSAHKV